MKTRVIITWICFALACVCMITGILLLFLMGTIIHKEIASTIPLKKGSLSYNNWLDPPVPVYMQFWLFSVANGEDVQQNGARPELVQKGPYTYQEHRVKKDIKFNPNGTVSYRQEKIYTFVEAMSQGTEQDQVINLNLLLVALSQQVSSFSMLVKQLLAAYFSTFDGKGVFVNHTVHEWLWGYEDPGVEEIMAILKKIHLNISLPIPAKIGLYYGKNGTDDGLYTIYTGTDNVSDFSLIQRWNGVEHLKYWNSDIANDINGTDGTTFPPFITKDDKLYIFSSDLCRSIDVVYEKPVTLKGIELMRFVPPAMLFANHTVNPDNEGYCTPTCLGSGVLNVSRCQSGQPAIMSQPHFFQADPKYLNAVKGLAPSAELSQTRIDVDSHTGVVLNAAKKLQVNIDVHPVAGFDMLSKINLFMPVVWVNESASVDDKSANKFKKEVLGLINIAHVLQYAVFGFGTAFLLVMLVILIVVLRKTTTATTEEEQNIINNDSQEAC